MALLTILSLPWMVAGALRVGVSPDAFEPELVRPLYMTGIEISSRLLSAAMALGVVSCTARLWTRICGPSAGLLAAIVVAANAPFIYYAHTGNLDVPYLFWCAAALLELDRVACGEGRETRALLLATAAVLTKDQAAAALLLVVPVWMLVIPWLARREPIVRPRVLRALAFAVFGYALVSGALVNPMGFRARVATLLGPASQSWAGYPRGWLGTVALARDALHAVPEFTSWPVALLAAVGVPTAIASTRGLARARALLPLAAALSFTLLFTLTARRTEHRFLLPHAIWLLPYASFPIERVWRVVGPRARTLVAAAAVGAAVPAVLGVASMDGTLLADPRYEAERFLKAQPPGTHVEVYGGPIFLPRIPPQLAAARPGIEPIADRQRIPGIEELVDAAMDPRARAPALLVLSTEVSNLAATEPSPAAPYGLMGYRDDRSRAFFRSLWDGSLGYQRVLRAMCHLPWPLSCRRVHDSTGGEVWIYAPVMTRSAAGKS
jgi:4-amino-4-deoxy-L-arabinose transferase-like glycosyltransferase